LSRKQFTGSRFIRTAQKLFESEFPILPPGSRKKPSVQAAGNDLGVKKSEET
jgi:hypothetical protein